MANPNIYNDGVELICPAVYAADSAAEALALVVGELSSQVAELSEAVERAYDAYEDDSDTSAPVNYFSLLDEEEED